MKPSLTVRVSCWCAGHSNTVVALWLVFVALAEMAGLSGVHRPGGGPLFGPEVAANWWPLVAAPIAVLLTAPFSRLLLLVATLFISVVTAGAATLLKSVSQTVPLPPHAVDVALLIVITVSVQHMVFTLCRSREALAGGNDAPRVSRIVASTAGNATFVSGSTVAVSLTAVALVGTADLAPLATAVLVVVLIATIAALSLLPALNDRVLAQAKLPLPPLTLHITHLPRFVRPATMAAGLLILGAAAAYGSLRVFSAGCESCRPMLEDLDVPALLTLLGVLGLATLLVYRRPVLASVTVLLNCVAALAGLGVLAVVVDPLPRWAPTVLVVVLLVSATHLQVYLLHRLRSETLAGMSGRNTVTQACRRAWAASGGALVVTVVMWLVWGMTEREEIREFALATAAALVVDTTIVRFVLLPRLAVLGGRATWWR